MKIVFFELEEWEIAYLKGRIVGFDTEYYTTSIKETTNSSIFEADIISVFIYSPVDVETLDKFKNLKFITTRSTGFDHVNIEECKRKNISVCNVPAYGDNTVAEHAFGLILNLSRNIHKAYLRTSQGKFNYEGLMGFDLKNKTLGVLGTGKIGQHVIRMARGFEMNVVAYDPYPRLELQDQLGFKYLSVEELFSVSDVITIHVPLTSSTYHLINEDNIKLMKTGVLIINTARGGVVDTAALLQNLSSGKIGGAGLDVLEGETLIREEKELLHEKKADAREKMIMLLENYQLMKLPNVIVTPHLAFYSKEGVQRILNTTLDNLFDYIENRGLRNQIKK